MIRFTISTHALDRFRERYLGSASTELTARLLLSRLLLSAKPTGRRYKGSSVWTVQEQGQFKGLRVIARESRFMGKGAMSVLTVLPIEVAANDEEMAND